MPNRVIATGAPTGTRRIIPRPGFQITLLARLPAGSYHPSDEPLRRKKLSCVRPGEVLILVERAYVAPPYQRMTALFTPLKSESDEGIGRKRGVVDVVAAGSIHLAGHEVDSMKDYRLVCVAAQHAEASSTAHQAEKSTGRLRRKVFHYKPNKAKGVRVKWFSSHSLV